MSVQTVYTDCMSAEDTAQLRIGELARRTKTSPEVLRAWERRYRLLRPARTAGGFRLYTAEDEERIRRMQEQLRNGVSAAEAARIVLSEESAAVAQPVEGADGAAAELLSALERYDEPAAQTLFDRLFAVFDEASVVTEIVFPVLRELGERWRVGRFTVAQEHFASAVVRGRLLGLARGWDRGLGPRALLACPPEEQHDLGLLGFGVLLRREGWRVVFLGADTPLDALAGAVRDAQPSVVVLAAVDARRFRHAVTAVTELASTTPVRLGGEGASGRLHAALDPLRLPGDPVEAAALVTREHGR